MSPECSKQDAELCQTACGERTNIKFVLISVLQSAQQINSARSYSKRIEYPFKQNENVLKNMTGLFYTYFDNISLNVLRPTFSNIRNLPFLHSPNIGKIRVKVGPKTNYFFLLYEPLHQQN